MGRPGIAYDTVRTFIDSAVIDGGPPPSIAAIIKACGGSATTVARYKRRYLDDAAARRGSGDGTAANGVPLPDGLERSIARGATALWAECLDALNDREAALEAAYAEKSAELDARLAKAMEAQQRAEQHAHHLQTAEVDLKQELGAERTAHAVTQKDLSESREGLAARTAEKTALEAQLNRTVADHRELVTDWEARLVEADQRVAHSEERTRARIASLEAGHEKAERSWGETLADKERRLDACSAELAAARRQLAKEEKAQAKLAMRAETLSEQLQASKTQADRNQTRIEELRQELSAADSDSAAARAKIAGMTETLNRAERGRDANAVAHQQQLADKDRQLDELRATLATLTNALQRLEPDPRT